MSELQPPPADPTPATPGVPPGWYRNPVTGINQWWDGAQWGPVAPTAAAPVKDTTVAYLLLIFLGGFGAHQFYLRNPGIAIAQAALWWGGWLFSGLIIGFVAIAAVAIWWIVDLSSMRAQVETANARAGAL